jgi:polyvinyl alcohol dehydrogenase (cytochrome)
MYNHQHKFLTRFRRAAISVMTGIAAVALAGASPSTFGGSAEPDWGFDRGSDWPMFGGNLANTANGSAPSINPLTVKRLAPKWVFQTQADVSARAAIVADGVYFPDFSGNLYRLNANTGGQVWSKNLVADYGLTPPPGSTKVVSRTSPAVHRDTLYIGTQTTASGAFLLAINTKDGSLRWKVQVDAHPLAIETSSPVIVDGVVYTGVAGLEEVAAANPAYPCCSFRGSALAIDAETGAIIWKHYTAPAGYSGAGVWGSSVVPDIARGLLYITTGNNYSTPTSSEFMACAKGQALTDTLVTQCLSDDDLVDSVAALDLKTGELRWSHRLWTQDDWNASCVAGFAAGQGNCPNPEGPDFDFASGANLFVIHTGHGTRTVLGAGHKSGIYMALDPDTGKLLWATAVGPGSALGGMEWGSATDGTRIYVAISNLYGIPYSAGKAGSWSALDPATGKILWQTPDPNGSLALGPVTVANGVVYAPSMAGSPEARNMIALDASSGAVLWQFAAGGSVVAGASIANDTVYWGSGYSNLPLPGITPNNKFYAFGLKRR